MEPEYIAVFTGSYVLLIVLGYISYRGGGELVIVGSIMKRIYYIDILDHNLLDFVDNMFGDATILLYSNTTMHQFTQCVIYRHSSMNMMSR